MPNAPRAGRINIADELRGALAAMGMTLPLVLALGLLAYGRMGGQFEPLAMMTALSGLCLGGVVAGMLSSNPVTFGGPNNGAALLLASLMATLYGMDPGLDPYLAFGLCAVAVAVAAGFVFLVTILRLGRLVDYIPFPVLAGFMNGLALLIISEQLAPILGLPDNVPLWRAIGDLRGVPLGSIVPALVALVTILGLKARGGRLPGTLVGIAAGSLALPVLGWLGWDTGSVRLLQAGGLTLPPYATVASTMFGQAVLLDWPWWYEVIMGGLALGVLISLQTSLYAARLDEVTGHHGDNRRNLLALGLGNLVSALTLSMPVCGMLNPSVEAHRYGARSRLAGPLSAAAVAGTVVFLAPLVSLIPLPAIAGMLVAVAVGMVDEWSLRFFLRLGTRMRNNPYRAVFDLAVCLAVTGFVYFTSTGTAILVGVLMSTLLFVVKMSRGVVRDHYSGRVRFSRVVHTLDNLTILREEGQRLRIFELYGALFFGTAGGLGKEVLANIGESRHCLLDMRLVTEMDTSGAMSLLALRKDLAARGVELYLGHLPDGDEFLGLLEAGGYFEGMAPGRIFGDTEVALAHIEELILEQCRPPEQRLPRPLSLAHTDAARGFGRDDVEILARYWTPRSLETGLTIMKDDRPGNELILVLDGAMTAGLTRRSGRTVTMAELIPGSVFNVTSWLDGTPSHLSVWATTRTALLTMDREQYRALYLDRPDLAHRMLANLLRVLGTRFRAAKWELLFMEDK